MATRRKKDHHIDLQSLDGVRALANIWVAVYHVYGIFIPSEPVYIERERKNILLRLIINGVVGVDIFFVLTGTLAAYTLLPKLVNAFNRNAPIKPILKDYYKRRIARIIPLYALGLATSVLVAHLSHRRAELATPADSIAQLIYQNWFAGCPQLLWMNLLFINNRGIPTGCGVAYWSLAITFQFYFVFPLVTLLVMRLAGSTQSLFAYGFYTISSLLVVSTVFRLWYASTAILPFYPLGFRILNPAALERLLSYLKYVYYPSVGRMTGPVVGVVLGYMLSSPETVKKVQEKKAAVGIIAAVFYVITLLVGVQDWHGYEAPWSKSTAASFAALLHIGSPLFAVTIALSFCALTIQTDFVHAALARILSSKVFLKLSDLSLGMYMFHCQIYYFWMLFLESYAPTWWSHLIQRQPDAALAVAIGGTLGGAYTAAALSQMALRLFSKRIMK